MRFLINEMITPNITCHIGNPLVLQLGILHVVENVDKATFSRLGMIGQLSRVQTIH